MNMNDKNDLSKLYPEKGMQADNANRKIKVGLSKNQAPKITFLCVLHISSLLTLVVAIIIVMISFFEQTINAGNIINLLPMVTILLLAWVGFLVVVLISISKRLEETAVSNVTFLVVYGLCALPTAQLIFNLCRHFGNGAIGILPFIGMLFVENIIFVSLILGLMNTEKLSSKIKSILLLFMVVFCLFITFINTKIL